MVGTVVLSHYMSLLKGTWVTLSSCLSVKKKKGGEGGVVWCIFVLTMRPFCALGGFTL